MSSETKRGRVIAVTGGRNFKSRAARSVLWGALDEIHYDGDGPIAAIVQGGASGADALARDWVDRTSSALSITCDAEWSRDGRAAGPIRNKRMLEILRPDMLVACPGGAGTASCIAEAERLGIPVRRLEIIQ